MQLLQLCVILKVWLEMEILCAAFFLKLSSTKRTASKPALVRGNGDSVCVYLYILECVCVSIHICTQTFFVA